MTTAYRAFAERHGHGWRVRIEGVGGSAGVQARDLADVEPRVRKLIWSYTGCNPADIDLDVVVRLPPAIQVRVDLAEQLALEAVLEIESSITDLLAAGMSIKDVAILVTERCRMPRAFAVRNFELGRYGMVMHPEAIGLRWDDHGRFLTMTCRQCVIATRRLYRELEPDDLNVLIYDLSFRCDRCEKHIVPDRPKPYRRTPSL